LPIWGLLGHRPGAELVGAFLAADGQHERLFAGGTAGRVAACLDPLELDTVLAVGTGDRHGGFPPGPTGTQRPARWRKSIKRAGHRVPGPWKQPSTAAADFPRSSAA